MIVEAVLFDFGRTLDSSGLTWLERFYPIYWALGIRVPQEYFARAVARTLSFGHRV